MSEFYRLRRSKITDGLALLGFIIGFIVPAYDAAQHLVTGFENPGQEAQGLTDFAIRILLNAFAGGALGLVAGIIIGFIWERIHKVVRKEAPDVTLSAAESTREQLARREPAGTVSARSVTAPAPQRGSGETPEVKRVADSRIRFDNGGFAASEFLALTSKVIPGDYDPSRTAAALEKTTNIGAWDGAKLVGAVRLLSDGYLYSTISEIVVDPEYRRIGIGRELMTRALDNSETGVVLLASPPEASGFFEKLGCQRAPSGYVLRRKKAPAVTVR